MSLINGPLEAIAKVWSKIGFIPGEIQSPGGTRWRRGFSVMTGLAKNRWAPASTSSILSLPKMSSDANVFEISDIQEDETEASLKSADQCNNVRSPHRHSMKIRLTFKARLRNFAVGSSPELASHP